MAKIRGCGDVTHAVITFMRLIRRHSPHATGFSLMETVIALTIFSLAAVALAEAIQQSGQSSNIIRQDIQIQDRMAALTAETMRLVALTEQGARPAVPDAIEVDGVSYQVRTEPLKDVFNKDKVPVEGIYVITTNAEWMEGGEAQQLVDTAWIDPRMLPPLR
jgi:type II secretory pathway pseudopilin PulG